MSKNRTESRELSPKHLQTQGYLAPGYLNQKYCSTLYFSISLIILKPFGTRLMQHFCWQLKVYLKAEDPLSDKVKKLSQIISTLEFSATDNVI